MTTQLGCRCRQVERGVGAAGQRHTVAMAHAPLARHLLRAKDLADARYFEPLSVADLAAAAGMSPAISVVSSSGRSASRPTSTC